MRELGVTVEPWIIDELERRRREEEEAEEARRSRIELPLSKDSGAAPAGERESTGPSGRVVIVEISPPSEHVVDV